MKAVSKQSALKVAMSKKNLFHSKKIVIETTTPSLKKALANIDLKN